jgi:hypothetical protein
MSRGLGRKQFVNVGIIVPIGMARSYEGSPEPDHAARVAMVAARAQLLQYTRVAAEAAPTYQYRRCTCI